MEISEVGVAIGALATGAGALIAAWEYRLKARAQRVEIDVKLSQLFAELSPVANARRPDDAVGLATQMGVVASLGYLGAEHDAIHPAAVATLESLRETFEAGNHAELVAAADKALAKLAK